MHHKSIWAIVIILTVLLGCRGLVSLQVPVSEELDFDSGWMTLGRNRAHQHYALHNIVPPLQVVWKTRIKSVVVDHPLVIGDYILAATRSGMIHVIDYQSGLPIGDDRIGSGLEHVPSIYNHVLFAGFNLGKENLIAFDLRRAERLYKKQYPPVNTTPLVWEDRVYFGTAKSLFFCANAFSGKEIWRFQAEAPMHSSPALHSRRIIFADDRGTVYSLDASSGVEFWRKKLNGNVFSHPVVSDSMVYIGTVSGKLYALSIHDGQIAWSLPVNGSIYGSPSVFQDMLYLGTNSHQVLAIQKETGVLEWDFSTDGIVNTTPLASPDYLYVACWDKNLYVLNRTSGKLVFKMTFKKPLKSAPIIYRDYLLVHTANHRLIALANEKLIVERESKK